MAATRKCVVLACQDLQVTPIELCDFLDTIRELSYVHGNIHELRMDIIDSQNLIEGFCLKCVRAISARALAREAA